jgi:hypothetical protein
MNLRFFQNRANKQIFPTSSYSGYGFFPHDPMQTRLLADKETTIYVFESKLKLLPYILSLNTFKFS